MIFLNLGWGMTTTNFEALHKANTKGTEGCRIHSPKSLGSELEIFFYLFFGRRAGTGGAPLTPPYVRVSYTVVR